MPRPLRIARRDLLAGDHLLFEDRELLDQDRRLQRVEARVQADMDVVVLRLALAVEGERAELRGERVVIGEHGAAVAVAAERLGRIEAGAGDLAERAALPAAERAADRLRGVLDDQQVLARGDLLDRRIVGRQAEQVDRDDRLRREAAFALDHLDRRLEAGDVDVVGVGIDVDEDRLGLGQRHHFGGRGEGEARHENGVAGADAGSHRAAAAARRCRWRSRRHA